MSVYKIIYIFLITHYVYSKMTVTLCVKAAFLFSDASATHDI